MTDFKLPDIPGQGELAMLSYAEGRRLAELAQGRTVLEIGSFQGLSTVVLARVARRVFSLDHHQGDAEMGKQDSLPQLVVNLRRHGVENVVLLVGKTKHVLPHLDDRRFDMVYIDGAHDEASVAYDTAHALRLVCAGGVLVWHDAEREPVQNAIRATGLAFERGPGRLAVTFKI